MEVKIISQELIKPSSPTPQHLRTFKLSLLDQLIQFYPLAGKIQDCLSIDCNDGGARFVEASVNMSLTQFLTDPDLILLNKLIPCDEFAVVEFPELTHAANIQVNVFQCGGIALAICNTHKLHDGGALGVFLKEWTAAAWGGGTSASRPVAAQDLKVAAELFPANDLWLNDLSKIIFSSMSKTGNSVTKRFMFNGPAIEALRARGKGPSAKNPTRVEAVTGFLWMCALAAFKRKNNGIIRPSIFTHVVNIRKRMNPPLSGPIGNVLWMAAARYRSTRSHHTGEDVLPSVVGALRGAISKVDGDFVLGLRRDKSLICSSLEKVIGVGLSEDKVDTFLCSSWCRFGFYDTDFGWGKPIW
ncbi:hypothetical protein CRG98_048118, partial [Punica granatum]